MGKNEKAKLEIIVMVILDISLEESRCGKLQLAGCIMDSGSLLEIGVAEFQFQSGAL